MAGNLEIDVTGLDVLTIVVDGNKENINIRQFLRIDDQHIEKEVADSPSNYGWYGAVLAHYEYYRDVIERELKEMKATKSLMIRSRYRAEKASGGKDATEGMIKEELDRDGDVCVKEREYLRASLVCAKLKAFVNALEKKGERTAQIYSRWKMLGRIEGA